MSDITRSEALKELKEYEEGLDMKYATPFDKAILFAISSLETDEFYQLEYESTTKSETLVSLDAYKQVAQERDIAIQQLHELGYEFGQKIEPTAKNDLGVDCISRKAVLEMAKSYNTDGWDMYTPLVVDVEDIEELPSVTPKRPKGQWIYGMESKCGKVKNIMRCSNCKCDFYYDYDGSRFPYCPNCGARMVESQESEDQNEC